MTLRDKGDRPAEIGHILCSDCGERAEWLVSGDDLGHRFTDVPLCAKCFGDLEQDARTHISRTRWLLGRSGVA